MWSDDKGITPFGKLYKEYYEYVYHEKETNHDLIKQGYITNKALKIFIELGFKEERKLILNLTLLLNLVF
jgi:hypothetical protein